MIENRDLYLTKKTKGIHLYEKKKIIYSTLIADN